MIVCFALVLIGALLIESPVGFLMVAVGVVLGAVNR